MHDTGRVLGASHEYIQAFVASLKAEQSGQSGSPTSTNAAQKCGDAYGRSLSPPAGIEAANAAGVRALAPLLRSTPPDSTAVRGLEPLGA
jgi:hypothetical protein